MDWNNFLWLIFLGFVCYRLAELIAVDDWPFFIMNRIRGWVDAKSKAEQEAGIKKGKWESFSDGINCPFCIGFWMAIIIGVVYAGLTWYTLVYILAIAGVQSWLESWKR